MRQKTAKKRGFNLIEAAIVLGVVGLVIGGIWVAAATVSENMKVNDTINGAAVIANNTQRLISVRDGNTMGGGYITSTLLAADVFPKDWVSGTDVKNPYNGDVAVGNGGDYFTIFIYDIPQSACIKLASRLTSIPGNGLNTILFDPANWGTTTFPMTSDLAATICVAGNNDVWLAYDYTRAN